MPLEYSLLTICIAMGIGLIISYFVVKELKKYDAQKNKIF